jgi:hypothetical protein
MNLKLVKLFLTSIIVGLFFIPIYAAKAQIDIYVILQGDNRPEPQGWQIPLTVRFFEPGTDVNLYEYVVTTSKSNRYAVGQVWGVPPDTYDITVKSQHTMLNVKRNVMVTDPCCAVDMGTLIEGNADDNDIINFRDYAILASAWLAAAGDVGFDGRADFDCNGNINMSDLDLLTSNWLQLAPIEILGTTEVTAVCCGTFCEHIEPEQQEAHIILTGDSIICLISDFFSEVTNVEMYIDGYNFDITDLCQIVQYLGPGGLKNYIEVRFDSMQLPVGPLTYACYTIKLHPLPPAPSGSKTSDVIWILTNGFDL